MRDSIQKLTSILFICLLVTSVFSGVVVAHHDEEPEDREDNDTWVDGPGDLSEWNSYGIPDKEILQFWSGSENTEEAVNNVNQAGIDEEARGQLKQKKSNDYIYSNPPNVSKWNNPEHHRIHRVGTNDDELYAPQKIDEFDEGKYVEEGYISIFAFTPSDVTIHRNDSVKERYFHPQGEALTVADFRVKDDSEITYTNTELPGDAVKTEISDAYISEIRLIQEGRTVEQEFGSISGGPNDHLSVAEVNYDASELAANPEIHSVYVEFDVSIELTHTRLVCNDVDETTIGNPDGPTATQEGSLSSSVYTQQKEPDSGEKSGDSTSSDDSTSTDDSTDDTTSNDPNCEYMSFTVNKVDTLETKQDNVVGPDLSVAIVQLAKYPDTVNTDLSNNQQLDYGIHFETVSTSWRAIQHQQSDISLRNIWTYFTMRDQGWDSFKHINEDGETETVKSSAHPLRVHVFKGARTEERYTMSGVSIRTEYLTRAENTYKSPTFKNTNISLPTLQGNVTYGEPHVTELTIRGLNKGFTQERISPNVYVYGLVRNNVKVYNTSNNENDNSNLIILRETDINTTYMKYSQFKKAQNNEENIKKKYNILDKTVKDINNLDKNEEQELFVNLEENEEPDKSDIVVGIQVRTKNGRIVRSPQTINNPEKTGSDVQVTQPVTGGGSSTQADVGKLIIKTPKQKIIVDEIEDVNYIVVSPQEASSIDIKYQPADWQYADSAPYAPSSTSFMYIPSTFGLLTPFLELAAMVIGAFWALDMLLYVSGKGRVNWKYIKVKANNFVAGLVPFVWPKDNYTKNNSLFRKPDEP